MSQENALRLGRIKSCNGMNGEAEFSDTVQVGDLCYFVDRRKNNILCKVVGLNSSHLSGIMGSFRIVDRTQTVPQAFTELYRHVPPIQKGAFLDLGEDFNGVKVQVRVNNLFGHTVMTGKTHSGKTKMTLKMGEEMVKQSIPHLIIDPQGEHIGLQQFDAHVDVVEDDAPNVIMDMLRKRRTVVVNLLGMEEAVKAKRLIQVLGALKAIKEKEYRAAVNGEKLRFPPVLVTVDEAEIFASSIRFMASNKDAREMLVYYAKRMSKMGVGLMLVVQRLPRLDPDVRSQCNNAILFHSDDGGVDIMRRFSFVTEYDIKLVQSLTYDECVVTGSIIDRPTLMKVGAIRTPRMKPTDYESMLGLDVVSRDRPKQAGGEAFQSNDDDHNILCGGCGNRTKVRVVHAEGYTHQHFACEKCGDDYCPNQKKWVKSAQ